MLGRESAGEGPVEARRVVDMLGSNDVAIVGVCCAFGA